MDNMNNMINMDNIIINFNKDSDILIYIIYHDEESFKLASIFLKYNWARLRKIDSTKYFENIIFSYLDINRDEWINKKFVGFLTYNSYKKINIFDIEKLANQYSDYDVISLNNSFNIPLLLITEHYHPNFINIWEQILLILGYNINDILSLEIPLYYNNYWLAKPEWLNKYIIFYKKVIDIMENNILIRNMLYQNSTYPGKLLEHPQKLIKICGRPYYTYHTFIFERLVCFFFWVEKAKLYQTRLENDPILNI
jgi:hypothetical protein